ncbi:Retinoblastoma-related protein [Populus trichocarpa] [Rhizoctonia solani]|uniref:Retinoblastoma-related protein [Populus trichocarpa] n=1 Tax=Rhizoctonia solani TaxID=456999 RepID=A0A0K6G4K1_9AGAM|nr:Retinoblastoma-related protein [Populus trichocarpa] [Rhizoctonia solani]
MARKSHPGPAGTSCLTCKRRHKKCDRRRPTCESCETGEFECLGYDHIEGDGVGIGRTRHLRSIVPKAPGNDAVSSSRAESDRNNSGGSLLSVEQLENPATTSLSLAPSASPNYHQDRTDIECPIGDGGASALVNSRTRRVEDYLYLFATRSPLAITESPNSILHKIVKLQTQLPYSPLDPLKTFLTSHLFVEYVLAQSDKFRNYWYFKPKNYEKNRDDIVRRLQTSDLSRWITLVAMAVIESFLTGDALHDSRHNFWLEYIEGSVKRELTRDLAPHEMQERRSDWIHIHLLRAMVINSSSVYQILRDVTPTFLQVVFSNPILWSSGQNVTHVPLSNILSFETNKLAFFALLDCTCAMAFGLPQQVEYDTTIYPRTSGPFSHQWSHITPAEFQLLLTEINACRDGSPTARDKKDIEQSLLTWQSRPGEYTFAEAWMGIAWYALQESWRLALLVYLYLAVWDIPSDDTRIQTIIKQMLQVLGTIKKRKSSGGNVTFVVQYLMIGICARSEAHRKAVRDKLSAQNEIWLWLIRASDFVPVLDDLWHGVGANGRPVRWQDYMRSREAMLPVVHKKCDQRQPICERCEAGHLECLGYGHIKSTPILNYQSTGSRLLIAPDDDEPSPRFPVLEPGGNETPENHLFPEEDFQDTEPTAYFHNSFTSANGNEESAISDPVSEDDGVVQSFLAGDMTRCSQHHYWIEHIENSAKRELTRQLAPREMQDRCSDWVHVLLMKSMITQKSNIYQILRTIAPTFLQVVYSDPRLWPYGCNPAYIPLSKILLSEVQELAFFALMDCTCAMAFGLPHQVEYDTTVYSPPAHSPSHQWAHSTPAHFQLLLADINACRDKSPNARKWREIESCLQTWRFQSEEDTFTESWMTIAWYAVQESWRLALLAYLYMAVCETSSNDSRVQSCIKQVLQVIGIVKERGLSSMHVSFFVQYLIVGICARTEAHRKVVYEKLSACNTTRFWFMRAADFVPVLDHLWHGAAAGGRPIRWSDYMRSREMILPVAIQPEAYLSR